MVEPVVDLKALGEHVWGILAVDVLGQHAEMAEEPFAAMLVALCVVSGKGVLPREQSVGILNDGWARYVEKVTSRGLNPAEHTRLDVRRAVYRMLKRELMDKWSEVTPLAVHGVLLGALVVVSKGRVSLETVRKSLEHTWEAYEIPPELRAS